MNWVVLCGTVWMLYSSEQAAKNDISDHPNTAQTEGCGSPISATDKDVAFYKSHDFAPLLAHSLENVWLNREREVTEAAIARNEAAQKFIAGEDQDDRRDEPEKTPEASVSKDGLEKHCTYTFVRTGKHSLRMETECYMIKPKEQ